MGRGLSVNGFCMIRCMSICNKYSVSNYAMQSFFLQTVIPVILLKPRWFRGLIYCVWNQEGLIQILPDRVTSMNPVETGIRLINKHHQLISERKHSRNLENSYTHVKSCNLQRASVEKAIPNHLLIEGRPVLLQWGWVRAVVVVVILRAAFFLTWAEA